MMENITVAIVSSDEAYNRALMMAMVSVCRELSVRSFTGRQFVNNWTEYSGKGEYYDTFDIILWAGEEISESYGDNIVYLTDKASLIRKDYSSNRFCIYKYSTANTMVAAIFDIYAHLTGRSAFFVRKNDVRFFAFASPAGGVGTSTLSVAVGQELSRFHGKKVMYLTMEDVESTSRFFEPVPGAKPVGEFLYRLLAKPEAQSDKMPFLDSYLVRDVFGMEAFAPTCGKNPLRELSADDIQKFLATLLDCGRYDIIVADLSSCLTDAAIAAMTLAERICLVSNEESRGREENYLSQVICCGGEDTLEKISRVENMTASGHDHEDAVQEMIRTAMHIRKLSAEHGGCDILLEGDFGEDIRRLAAMLTEPCRN